MQAVVKNARFGLRGDAVRMGRTGAAATLYESRRAPPVWKARRTS